MKGGMMMGKTGDGRSNCKDVDERKATTQPEVIYYTSNTHTPPPPPPLPLSLHSLTPPRVVLSKLLLCFLLHLHFTPSLSRSAGSL